MKFYQSTKIFTFSLLILISFHSNASINDATWYVSIDVDQIENNEIYKMLEANSDKSSGDFNVEFNKLPKEISYISIYGNAQGAEDATAVIHGDFSQFSINEYVLNFLYTQDDVSKLIKEDTITYKNNEIQVLKIDEDEGKQGDKLKNAYFSQINNDLTVISFNLDEVKNWLNHDYDNHDIIQGSLFSVVVDVQSALAHMGMNIEKNNHMMKSEIFQKVSQASASVSQVNSDMVLDVALTTNDEATAIQIEQVINGLVAMSNLSGANDENELQSVVMQNLNIERNGNNILISSYASINDLKRQALQDNNKHHNLDNQDKKVKVEVNIN